MLITACAIQITGFQGQEKGLVIFISPPQSVTGDTTGSDLPGALQSRTLNKVVVLE